VPDMHLATCLAEALCFSGSANGHASFVGYASSSLHGRFLQYAIKPTLGLRVTCVSGLSGPVTSRTK
jgi:hypothetical protein